MLHPFNQTRTAGQRCFSRRGGFTLVEVMVAAAILVLVTGSVVTALTMVNRDAAANRNRTAGKLILQRAIDTALAVTWRDPAAPPRILTPTLGAGVPFEGASGWVNHNLYTTADDLTGNATVPVYEDRDASQRDIVGKVYRKVQRAPGNDGLMLVSMRLDYRYRGKPVALEMSTERAVD